MDIQSILLLIALLLSINLILVGVYIVLVIRDVRKLIAQVEELVVDTKSTVKKFSGSMISLPVILKTAIQIYRKVKNGKE